jgi:hypothetical protein
MLVGCLDRTRTERAVPLVPRCEPSIGGESKSRRGHGNIDPARDRMFVGRDDKAVRPSIGQGSTHRAVRQPNPI